MFKKFKNIFIVQIATYTNRNKILKDRRYKSKLKFKARQMLGEKEVSH